MELGNDGTATAGQTQAPADADTAPTGTPAESERDTQNGGFDLASRMAELMRRERDLQSKESQWKSQGDKLKKLERLESAKSIDEKLAALDLDYSKITQHYLQKSENDQVEELKQRLAEVEGRTNEVHQKLTEKQLHEMQQQGMSDIDSFLQSSEEYPLIKALGEQDTIWHMVTGHYNQSGEVMDYATAAKLVEGELQKKLEGLRNHKETDWFKKTLGFDETPPESQPGNGTPAGAASKPSGHTEIVHNLLNAYRGEQAPSSLGAIDSGNATGGKSRISDAEARSNAFELLRKMRQG